MSFATTDGTEGMRIHSDGEVTKPLQPSFNVGKSSTQTNLQLNDAVTWDTEHFDIGANFSSNTFTAPVTGKYLMLVHLRWEQIPADTDYTCMKLITSNRSYQYVGMVAHSGFDAVQPYHSASFDAVVDMDANDTVSVASQGQNSTADIAASSTFWSGMLVG